MPNPVTFPASSLAITNDQNASAEAALAAFCQLLQNGTSGTSTPALAFTYPDPANPGSTLALNLNTTILQILYRHQMLALEAAGVGQVSLLRMVDTGQSLSLGYGAVYASNDKVGSGNSGAIGTSGVIGVSADAYSAGQMAKLVTHGVVPGALSGATAGVLYYLGASGQPSLSPGTNIIVLGVAKNATDLEVGIHIIS